MTDVKEKPKPAGFQVESRDGTIKEEQLNPLEKLVKELNGEEYEPTKKKVSIDYLIRIGFNKYSFLF